ncbi:hypothetical protein HBH98_111210 [Parastagonospora nodorum]|nr:hypothetical protein HBH98_111210 [Parastagonospora nodorum]KAH4376669.1 hypothetical protein HBH97_111970 [Parastagonospora nodorum]KAH4397111.1 hypothetical protein HBH99_118530 [Parastagonospora nodorum]KAH4413999.1 hypothetical protein HBH92_083010 [Parastagonospora nodorum]KAH4437463.1 hypothetical protein HBH93_098540 [Parastagonospora nodorum]
MALPKTKAVTFTTSAPEVRRVPEYMAFTVSETWQTIEDTVSIIPISSIMSPTTPNTLCSCLAPQPSSSPKKSVRFAPGPPEIRLIPKGMTDWANGEGWKRPRSGSSGTKLAREALAKAEAEEEKDRKKTLKKILKVKGKRRVALVVLLGAGLVRAVFAKST